MHRALLPAAAALLAAPLFFSQAQRPVPPGPNAAAGRRTAVESIDAARRATKKEVLHIVEMRGDHGMPDPGGWTIRFHDAASSSQLSYLEPGERPVPAEPEYEEGTPPVYFAASRVKLDSPDAFKAANREAEAAKIGFDSVDYQLRGREFTGEPVWTLRLLDADGELVGIVDLSAESGATLRTVWLRRSRETDEVRIIDSALAPGGTAAAAGAASVSAEKEPKALPPVPNIDPPPPKPAE